MDHGIYESNDGKTNATELAIAVKYLSGQDAAQAADIVVTLLTWLLDMSQSRSDSIATYAAIQALGEMKAQVGIPLLEAVISDPSLAGSTQKKMAEKALASIRSR